MQYTIGGELYHHGVLGMHWGVENGPPYPLSGDVSTGKRLKSGAKGYEKKSEKKGIVAKIKQHKQNKIRNANLEKARQAKQQKAEEKKKQEEMAAKKQEVLMKGTPQDVSKYLGQLTSKEYEDVLKRFQNEEQLKNYMQKTAPKVVNAWDRIDNVMNKVGKMQGYTEKGIKAYNNFAQVINTVSDLDLPLVPSVDKFVEWQRQDRKAAQAKKNPINKLINNQQQKQNNQTTPPQKQEDKKKRQK